jgi:hypothetical protein
MFPVFTATYSMFILVDFEHNKKIKYLLLKKQVSYVRDTSQILFLRSHVWHCYTNRMYITTILFKYHPYRISEEYRKDVLDVC